MGTIDIKNPDIPFDTDRYYKQIDEREKIVVDFCSEFGWKALFSCHMEEGGYSMSTRGFSAGETRHKINLRPLT